MSPLSVTTMQVEIAASFPYVTGLPSLLGRLGQAVNFGSRSTRCRR